MTPAQYPHLAPALPVLTSTDFAAHFTFGLRLLLEGLRATGPGPVPPPTGSRAAWAGGPPRPWWSPLHPGNGAVLSPFLPFSFLAFLSGLVIHPTH
ncbi:TetR/AcrR family transcriptional regulator C-terminal domain-containing protein [Streptomyces sp. CA2R101]|uniref:TetR/AcrR family transcriptional regulator C-terminal domain-containing protein n=1 Tax=Streptomyces sp. CA2R101 TaxID=3120152 RepID=UPI003FA70D61